MTHAGQLNVINISALTFQQATRAMSWLAITDVALIVGNGIENESLQITWLIHITFPKSLRREQRQV